MTDQQEMATARPDTEWTDAASTPTVEDYRELQAQHDQLQSLVKATMDTLSSAVKTAEFEGHAHRPWHDSAKTLLADQVPASASPDCELTVPMIDGLRRALTTMGISAPESLEELGWKQRQYVERLIRACQRLPASAVPEGWQLVPVEVTLPMQHAYFGVVDNNMRRVETDCRFGRYDSSKEAYRAMLAAAPKPEDKP